MPSLAQQQHDSQLVPPVLAHPPHAAEIKTHAIIISIATGDPTEPALTGVRGDFPLVLDELTTHTNGSIQIISDLQLPKPIPKAQTLLPVE
ncbi:hypothetical protein FS837_000874 [Tulasnella sp. UAMH 9824]|nr:hypothetical protein FS837_000874 [Tulasnella sp. UAMH 9824]